MKAYQQGPPGKAYMVTVIEKHNFFVSSYLYR